MASKQPREGDLRIWHIPQVPMGGFAVPVDSLEEGAKLLGVLASYDDFQYRHNVKPDYSNAQGLQVFEKGEWVEWEHPDNGDSILEQPTTDQWLNYLMGAHNVDM